MKQREMQGKKVYNIKFSGKDTYPKKKKVSEKQKQYVQLTHLDTSCGVTIVLYPK